MKEDGVYCKFCAFYAEKKVGRESHQQVGALCTESYQKWKKCIEKFNLHKNAEYRKRLLLDYLNLKKNIRK